MTLQRPALGAPWDKRLTDEALQTLLAQGPRAFAPGDVDLLDYLEQYIGERLAVPTVAGLVYAPGVSDVDVSGPAWPLVASSREGDTAAVTVASGHAVLSGRGIYTHSRVIAPLPAGRGARAIVEFRVDAAQGHAWGLRIGAVGGTVAEPGQLLGYPVQIGRGWQHTAFPDVYSGGPASDPLLQGAAPDLATVQLISGATQNTGNTVSIAATPVRGHALHLGRWYRLELIAAKPQAFTYGDGGTSTLYDAENGETLLSAPNLYTWPAPRLALQIGTPAYSEPASGFTAGPVSVTVRRWMEWRPVLT